MKCITDSVLYPLVDVIEKASDFETAQAQVLAHLDSLPKQQGKALQDMKKMKMTVQYQIRDLKKLQSWLWNCMQAYTGHKVI